MVLNGSQIHGSTMIPGVTILMSRDLQSALSRLRHIRYVVTSSLLLVVS